MTTTKKTTTNRKRATTTAKPKAVAQPIPDLPSNPFVFEVLEIASKQRSNAKKVEALQKFSHPCIKSLFIWNFDDSVQSVLPDGEVPYTKNPAPQGTEHTRLETEGRKLYYFVKGGADNIPMIRRESMFIQMLEGLHPDEAEILCLVKDKQLHKKYRITKNVVSEAFPSINWGGRGKPQ